MSVVYNGAHSITFIEALDSDTDSTPTAYSSYKRSWRDFHLVPEKRPSVNPPSPALKLIEIPGTSRRIDMTDLSPGGLKFGRRQGEWQFILAHELWDNWHVAKKTIEDAINGKRLYCILEDDFNTAYRGRFRVKGWQSGPDYSSISISYDLEYKKYINMFNILNDVTENKMLSSWNEVDKMIQDGSYRNNIAIGDSCYLYLPGAYNDYVDVVGMGISDMKIPYITWITNKLLKNRYVFEDSSTYDNGLDVLSLYYLSTLYRKHLYNTLSTDQNNTIFSLFPDRIQNMIDSVAMSNHSPHIYTYSYWYSGDNTIKLSTDIFVNGQRLWIPSYRELFGGSAKETTGPSYIEYFNSNFKRSKQISGPPNELTMQYVLRSSYDSNHYCMVNTDGNLISSFGYSPTNSTYILLGFFTGAST